MHPSRKQNDSFTPRVGSYVRLEKTNPLNEVYTLGNLGGPTNLPVLTVPAGYQARFLRIYARVNAAAASTNYYDLRIDNELWLRLTNTTGEVTDKEYVYAESPPAFTQFSVYVQQASTPVVHDIAIVLLYVLEQAGEGYFTN